MSKRWNTQTVLKRGWINVWLLKRCVCDSCYSLTNTVWQKHNVVFYCEYRPKTNISKHFADWMMSCMNKMTKFLSPAPACLSLVCVRTNTHSSIAILTSQPVHSAVFTSNANRANYTIMFRRSSPHGMQMNGFIFCLSIAGYWRGIQSHETTIRRNQTNTLHDWLLACHSLRC